MITSNPSHPTVPTSPVEPVPASVAPAPKAAPRKTARKSAAAPAPVSVEKAVKAPAAVPKKAAVKAALPRAPKARKALALAAPTAPAKTEVAAAKPHKLKARLVRDSFTMPQADFDLIGQLKSRALVFQRPAKKSELLRAGLQALAALDDAALHTALDALVPLKAGRPKKAD